MANPKKIDKNAPDVELRYSNWLSQLIQMMPITFLYIIAGRGTSKSTDILAERLMDISYDMQGAFIALSADTFMNAQKNILPSIIEGWQRKGWIEGVHYVVDERPPKHFKQPYKPIINWKHTVTIFTGTHIKVISQDRPSIGAGDSFQHHAGDEVKYLQEKKLNKVNPAVRGEYVRFGKSPFYGGATFTTDMPNVNHGEHDWILRMADNMDKKKIRKIAQVAFVVNDVRIELIKAQKSGNAKTIKLVEKKLQRWEERLYKICKGVTFFYIASSFVNADILTEGYFKKLLETMDFREFLVSILSILPKLEEGLMFYPRLSDKNFYADGFIYDRMDQYKSTDLPDECSLDLRYIQHDQPLEGGLDTGNMCSLVIGQPSPDGSVYRTLKNLWTLPPAFLDELGKDFREFFKYHECKELYLYHDRAANAYKSVGEDHASKIKKAIEFDSDGVSTDWVVTLMNEGQATISQQTEYELLLGLLDGKKGLPLLLIDKFNCRQLKSSMEGAIKIIRQNKDGNKTIHKDKSSEKLPNSELPMKSTNMSDGGKYLFCRPSWLAKINGEEQRFSGMPGVH